jgi:hypothetical protein
MVPCHHHGIHLDLVYVCTSQSTLVPRGADLPSQTSATKDTFRYLENGYDAENKPNDVVDLSVAENVGIDSINICSTTALHGY